MSLFGIKAKRAGVFGLKRVKRGVHALKNGGKLSVDAPSMKRVMGGRNVRGMQKSIEKM
tara:strand:+ start:298 stop:474 length:177 start_codon:yes stop_codon:yes gene_type:complete